MAAIARWWLVRAKRSCSSRVTAASRAWFSATSPGTEIHVGVLIHQRGIRRNLVAAHRHQAHRLGAARHDGRCEPAHHALRGVGDGLQAGGAEAVHRHGGGGHRDAGTQAGNPRDVHPLFRFGHRASENHVVHIGGIDVPRAAQRFGDDRRREIVRAGTAKRSPSRLADGGARGRYDNGVFHKSPSPRLRQD